MEEKCAKCKGIVRQGYTECSLCASKRAIRGSRYYRKNIEAVRVRLKENKVKRWNDGRCYTCGCPLLEDETKYCVACKSKEKGH